MSIFKRGRVYWFHFYFEGRHYQQSTKQGNPKAARTIEATFRSDLAKGRVGIKKQMPVPTFEEFKPRVLDEIKKLHGADHPRTIQFYEQTFQRVLTFKPLAKANLRDVDEQLISRFSTHQLDKVKPATINRALSVIRRTLYLAEEWKLIDRAPKVKMLEGERQREFVLTGALRDDFIGGLPEPCKTVARFLIDAAIHYEKAEDGATLGCGTAFDTAHGTNRPWRGRSRCVYNTSNRGTRICDYLAKVRASCSGDDPASREKTWRVPESRGDGTASSA